MQYFVSHIQSYAFLILLLAANADSPVRVFSQLNQFDKAPRYILPKLASPAENIDLQELDRPAILIESLEVAKARQAKLGISSVLFLLCFAGLLLIYRKKYLH